MDGQARNSSAAAIRRRRFMLLLLILALIAVMVACVFVSRARAARSARQRTAQSIEATASAQAGMFKTAINSRCGELEVFAATLDDAALGDAAGLEARLDRVKARADLDEMWLSSAQGERIAGDVPPDGAEDALREAAEGARSVRYLSGGALLDRKLLVMAVPVFGGQGGSAAAVLAGTFDIGALRGALSPSTGAEDGLTVICDAYGNVIASSNAVKAPVSGSAFELAASEGLSGASLTAMKGDFSTGRAGTLRFGARQAAYRPLGMGEWMLFCMARDGALDPSLSESTWGSFALIVAVAGVALVAGGVVMFLNKRQRARMLLEAGRDPLTGLLNRAGFNHKASRMLRGRGADAFTMSCANIDNFKAINDQFGHATGDRLLRYVSEQLGAFVDEVGGVSCRDSADIFLALTPHGPNAPTMRRDVVLERINRCMEECDVPVKISLRVGSYVIDDTSLDINAMIDRAMLAQQSIKGRANTRLAYYDDAMRKEALREQELSGQMRAALDAGQFQVWFQPQYDYDAGQLIGAEALVRWRHPEKGMISPGQFIPLFERNGFICELDRFVWEESCRYMRKWLNAGDAMPKVHISVNISRLDIYRRDLVDDLTALVNKYRLPAASLRLEITESAYMNNPSQLLATVGRLRAAGFPVEMDDFGSGYSSLNTLKDIYVDALKLDMCFLSKGENDVRGGNILASVIRMAHWLKLPVLAEGVETRAQADYLKSLGCAFMQGAYFSLPLPPSEFERHIARSRAGRMDQFKDVTLEGAAEFWNPSTQTALLFNSFVGGAAICEFRGGNAEIIRANDAFFEHIGATRARYATQAIHCQDDLDEKNRTIFFRMLEDAKQDAEAGCDVKRLPGMCDAGKEWLHCRARLLAMNGDSRLYYIAVENITGRKRMEARLRESSEELQRAMAQIGRIICRYDPRGGTLYSPEEYARHRGIPAVMEGMPLAAREKIVPEDWEAYADFFARIHAGQRQCRIEYRVRGDEGQYSWESAEAFNVLDEDGKPARTILSISDITDSKRQALDNARNRALVEYSGICLITYDVSSDTLTFESTLRGEGFVRRDIRGYMAGFNDEAHLIHAEDARRVQATLREACLSVRQGTVDYRADNWGIGQRWSRLSYCSLADEAGRVTHIVGHVEDIQNDVDRERLVESLSQQIKGRAAAVSFEPVLVETAFRVMYGESDAEKAIPAVLGILGEHYGLSGARVFERDANGAGMIGRYEWRAQECEPEQPGDAALEEALAALCADLTDPDGVFTCPDAESLPERARETARQLGARALAQYAIMDGDESFGAVTFMDFGGKREWQARQEGTLSLVSMLIGTFLVRRTRSADTVFSEDFMAALDNNSAYVYIIDAQSCRVLYTNRAIRDREEKDSLGCLCYSEFMGQDAPCEGCPARALTREGLLSPVELLRPDGTWLLTQASSLHWKGRSVVMLICTDITDRKNTEEALRITAEERAIVLGQSGKYVLRYHIGTGEAEYLFDEEAVFGAALGEGEHCEAMIAAGIVQPESVDAYRDFYRRLREGAPAGSGEARMRMADGRLRWLKGNFTTIYDMEGRALHVMVSFHDDTENHERERAYAQWQNSRMALLAQNASYIAVNLTANAVETVENMPKAEKLREGRTFTACVEVGCEQYAFPEDAAAFREFFSRERLLGLYEAGASEDQLEFRWLNEGRPVWLRAVAHLAKASGPDEIKAVIAFSNIDATRGEIQRLAAAAARDDMTGLLNRSSVIAAINRGCARPGSMVALYLFDMDDFRHANECLGRRQCDGVLSRVAGVISRMFREGDTVGRISGDVFAAFVQDLSHRTIRRKAAALVSALQFSVSGATLTASLGVAVADGGKTDFDELYLMADKALQDAKGRGKRCYSIRSAVDAPQDQDEDAEMAFESVPLATLLQNMDGGILVAEAGDELRVTYVSASLAEDARFGDGSGDAILNALQAEDGPSPREMMLQTARTGEPAERVFRVGPDGKTRARLRCSVCAAQGDGRVRVLGVLSDALAPTDAQAARNAG